MLVLPQPAQLFPEGIPSLVLSEEYCLVVYECSCEVSLIVSDVAVLLYLLVPVVVCFLQLSFCSCSSTSISCLDDSFNLSVFLCVCEFLFYICYLCMLYLSMVFLLHGLFLVLSKELVIMLRFVHSYISFAHLYYTTICLKKRVLTIQ